MNLDLMVYILEIIYQKIIKKGAYVINLDEYENTGTQCDPMSLYLLNQNIRCNLIVLV